MSKMRYDTTFVTKEMIRDASNPMVGSLQEVERIERYLIGRPRCVVSFCWSTQTAHRKLVWTVSGQDVRRRYGQLQAVY